MFGGQTFDQERDGERLKAQLDRVRLMMLDHEWHTLADLSRFARGSEAGVSARLRDLRKPRWGKHRIERRYIGNGLWEYRMPAD